MGLGSGLLQRVNGPHGQIGHQQESDDFPSGFFPDLVRGRTGAPGGVQNEDGLASGLQERRHSGHQHQHRVLLNGELAADDGESAVDVHASLGAHQQNVIQLQVLGAIVFKLAHLPHADSCRQSGHGVQDQLANVHLDHRQAHELWPGDQNKEQNERDDGEHQKQNAHEEAFMGTRTVHWVVVGALLEGVGLRFGLGSMAAAGRQLGDAAPHDVEDGCADQTVLYGAGEEEGGGVLHQWADYVGTPALVEVVGAFQAPGYYVVTMRG